MAPATDRRGARHRADTSDSGRRLPARRSALERLKNEPGGGGPRLKRSGKDTAEIPSLAYLVCPLFFLNNPPPPKFSPFPQPAPLPIPPSNTIKTGRGV